MLGFAELKGLLDIWESWGLIGWHIGQVMGGEVVGK